MKLKSYLLAMLASVFILGTLTNTAYAQPTVKLRNLERSPGEGYRIQTNASGQSFWIMGVSDEINVDLTPIAFVPATFGNVTNLNEVVTDPNGDIWIIDSAGDAVKIGTTVSFSGDWDDLTNVPAGFADDTDDINDADSDPLNEIQESDEVLLSTPVVVNSTIYYNVQDAIQAIISAGVGEGGGFSGDWADLTNVPAGFADDTDDVDDADASATNEIQVLSISNDTVFLSDGGFVKLPEGGSSAWGDLTGVPAGFADDTDDVDDADASATNEIQVLSISNDTVFLSDGGFVKLPAGGSADGVVTAGAVAGNTLSLTRSIGADVDIDVTALVGGGGGGDVDTVYVDAEVAAVLVEAQDFTKGYWYNYIYVSDGNTYNIEGMTEYEKGEQLYLALLATNSGDLCIVPPGNYKIPQYTGGLEMSSRASLKGLDMRRTSLIADSTHLFVFEEPTGAYRVHISDLTAQTVRTGEGTPGETDDSGDGIADDVNQWNVFHFEDRTSGTGGSFRVDNVHIAESDNVGVYLGDGWSNIQFQGMSATDAGDIHGDVLTIRGDNNRIDIDVSEGSILIDTMAQSNTVTLTSMLEDNIDVTDRSETKNNVIVNQRNLGVLRQNIEGGYGATLIHPYIKDPSKIAFYSPLDGASLSGSVVKDFSKHNLYGVIYNGVSLVETPFGQAMSFDGVDDFVEIVKPANYQDQDGKFFCSFLVKVTDTGNGGILYGGGMRLAYKQGADTPEFDLLTSAGSLRRGTAIDTAKWTHVALALTGEKYEVYYNGKLTAELSSTATINNQQGSIIVGRSDISPHLKMELQDLLIYDGYYEGLAKASFDMAIDNIPYMTSLDVDRDINDYIESDTKIYHPLDDLTGDDWGELGLDATISGNPTIRQNLFGGNELLLDGSGDFVTIPHNSIQNSPDMSLTMLANGTTITNKRLAFKDGVFDLFINDDLLCRLYRDGGTSVELSYATNPELEAGTYFQAGFARVADTAYLIYNGLIVDTEVLPGGSTWDLTSTTDMRLGNNSTTSYWNGSIDEFVLTEGFNANALQEMYQKYFKRSRFISSDLLTTVNYGSGTTNQAVMWDGTTLTDFPLSSTGTRTEFTQATGVVPPSGTTAERSPTPAPGEWRYNETTSKGETYLDGAFRNTNYQITATSTLDFPSTSASATSDLTITLTGAVMGEPVDLGVHNTAMAAGVIYFAWVSAADTITVRLFNSGAGTADPALGSFTVSITK